MGGCTAEKITFQFRKFSLETQKAVQPVAIKNEIKYSNNEIFQNKISYLRPFLVCRVIADHSLKALM